MAAYYISGTGNDSTGNGTLATPWLTVSKAFNSSAANDTIWCVASGGNTTLASQTWTSNRTIRGYPAGTRAALDAAAGNADWILNSTFTLTMIDLVFQNVVKGATGVGLFGSTYNNTWTWNFTNCIFKTITVKSGNPIFGHGQTDGGGAYNLTDCLFDDIIEDGAAANSALSFSVNATNTRVYTLTNCTFSFRTTGSTALDYIWYQAGSGAVTVIYKNCIIRCAVAKNHNLGGTFTNSATYSDFYQVTGAPSGTGTITSDPLFMDDVNRNFNLRPSSPCIDTGVIV